MTLSARLRYALVLFAILPGLLFQGGGLLRVCLHDWIDYEDSCTEAAAELPSTSSCADCCSDGQDLTEQPDHLAADNCNHCCIEIGCEGVSHSTPPSDTRVDSLCTTPQVYHVVVKLPAPSAPLLTPRPVFQGNAPPGRAPTPLRI